MDRTIQLTTEEIAKIDTLPRFGSAQQDEMLALRKRSGIRYGVQVKQGRFDIVTCAYALNKKGRPTGGAEVAIVQAGLLADEVIAAIRAL